MNPDDIVGAITVPTHVEHVVSSKLVRLRDLTPEVQALIQRLVALNRVAEAARAVRGNYGLSTNMEAALAELDAAETQSQRAASSEGPDMIDTVDPTQAPSYSNLEDVVHE